VTEDSICKNCVHRRRVVYQQKGAEGDLTPETSIEMSCRKSAAAGIAAGGITVLECSELERIEKPRDLRRYQH